MNPLGNNTVMINPAVQHVVETLRFVKNFATPQAFMQELQRQNPEMAQYILNLSRMIQNPLAAANQMLAQYGISPDQINGLISPN